MPEVHLRPAGSVLCMRTRVGWRHVAWQQASCTHPPAACWVVVMSWTTSDDGEGGQLRRRAQAADHEGLG